MQLIHGRLVQGQQGGFQAFGVGQKSGAYQKRSGPEIDERGIDTVETGARHQTDVDLGRRGSRGTAHSSSARSLFFRRSSRATSASAARLNASRSIARIGCAAGKTIDSGLRF